MKTNYILKLGLVVLAAMTLNVDAFSKGKSDQGAKKEFYVFDAINFRGKPDYLKQEGFSSFKLIYENALVTKGNIDWKKVNDKIRECKQQNCKTISIDIESWYSPKAKVSPEELKCRLDSIFKAFHEAIPNCEIGNYGVPVNALNIVRGWWPENMEKTEEKVIARWRKSSEVREPAGAVADMLMPCLYSYSPDMEQWVKDFNMVIDRTQELYPGKKIYVYLWPQCYNAPNSQYYMEYLSPDDMYIMLEEAYKRVDGAIIWTSTHSNMREKVIGNWDDELFQDTYSGISRFLKKYKIKAKR